MKNHKPKINHLNNQQIEFVMNMGFGVNINGTLFGKDYRFLDYNIKLEVVTVKLLDNRGNWIEPSVKIKFHGKQSSFGMEIQEFSNELLDLQNRIKADIKMLRQQGIITYKRGTK